MKVKLFDIQKNSYVDGPGIRTTVFFRGCNLKCDWCHNPESQSGNEHIFYYADKCTSCGKCNLVCKNNAINFGKVDYTKCTFCSECEMFCPNYALKLSGKDCDVDEVIDAIKTDIPFYNSSGGGVTFSGGECMLQADELLELLKRCKNLNIHTAVDTAGNVPWESFERILPYTDLFLYDIKAFSEDLHITGTGVSNKLILENLEKLSDKANIKARIPIIPSFNDKEDELKKISNFLHSINIYDVELLPYHILGEVKYKALNMPLTKYNVPTEEKMDIYKNLFK